MRTMKCRWWVLFCVSFLQVSAAAGVPDTSCEKVRLAARLARAKSLAAIGEVRENAGAGYIVEIVSAFRAFKLQPRNKDLAAHLLRKIPRDAPEQEVLLALDSSICDGEGVADMEALARVKYALPRMLARAVKLVPAYMSAYVSYSLEAAPDPHSDYAIQMQRVCRDLRPEFAKAVEALPETDRKWFTTGILDPKTCRAIAIPESD